MPWWNQRSEKMGFWLLPGSNGRQFAVNTLVYWTLNGHSGVGRREMVEGTLKKKKMESPKILKLDTRLRTIVGTVNKGLKTIESARTRCLLRHCIETAEGMGGIYAYKNEEYLL